MSEEKHYNAVHDREQQAYFVELEAGYQAEVSYQISGNVLTLDHSHVPDALRGKGYASIMMEAVLKAIEQEGYTIIPTCSYVAHYMNRHKEWHHLLSPNQ